MQEQLQAFKKHFETTLNKKQLGSEALSTPK